MSAGPVCTNPECGIQNAPGATICDGCDRPLAADPPPSSLDEIPASVGDEVLSQADPSREDRCLCQDSLVVAPERCEFCGCLGKELASFDPKPDLARSGQETEPPPQAASANELQWLQLRFGVGSVLKLEQSLIIGRDYAGMPPLLANWIRQHAGVSRRHCLLQYEAGRLGVIDLGSKNGTRVNGASIQAGHIQTLALHDLPHRIELGRFAHLVIEARERQS